MGVLYLCGKLHHDIACVTQRIVIVYLFLVVDTSTLAAFFTLSQEMFSIEHFSIECVLVIYQSLATWKCIALCLAIPHQI